MRSEFQIDQFSTLGPAGGQNFYPVERYGVKLISMGFFLTEKTPVIWRGPMVMGAVRQFLKDPLWGTQDFLIVDLPPGTGEAQLTLAQQVALDGAVIVTRRRTSRCSTRRGRRGCCTSCIARSSAWSRT
jgi:Mrp family chromosome partitioning ATPase